MFPAGKRIAPLRKQENALVYDSTVNYDFSLLEVSTEAERIVGGRGEAKEREREEKVDGKKVWWWFV